MIEQTNFPLLVERAMSLPGRANIRQVIEKVIGLRTNSGCKGNMKQQIEIISFPSMTNI